MISVDTEQLKELIKTALREVLAETTPAPTTQQMVNPEPTGKRGRPAKASSPTTPATPPEVVAPSPETTSAPATETASVAATNVTEDTLRDLCVEVAKKLGSAERIHEVLKGFGGRLNQIDKAKYPELDKALRMLIETSNEDW